ncbi:hypothetical protein Tco_1118328, partial [Tanacetum coccineum]
EALDKFAQAIKLHYKTSDKSVLLAGQAGTHPTEGEKNTTQVAITQFFQGRIAKDAERTNLNSQPTTTTTPTITTELIKKDKGKKAMSSKYAEEEDTRSDFDEDANLTGSMVEFSKKKKLKIFDFVTEEGFNKAKLQYDIYCDKILNIKGQSKITNCDVLTRKGPITLKVYREDVTSEIIPNFKASDLHLRLEIHFNKPLSEQDPILKLIDLARKKRKNADDIHEYFGSTK